MEYKRFTDEERQKAKNTDMIAFLESYMGFEFKKVGKYYQCRQHDSLMIYPDRQGFSWKPSRSSAMSAAAFSSKIFPLSESGRLLLKDVPTRRFTRSTSRPFPKSNKTAGPFSGPVSAMLRPGWFLFQKNYAAAGPPARYQRTEDDREIFHQKIPDPDTDSIFDFTYDFCGLSRDSGRSGPADPGHFGQ